MRQKFNPGEEVWVVERDEDGNACERSGYIFLADVLRLLEEEKEG